MEDDKEALIENLEESGITHPRILEVMRIIQREAFVPASLKSRAYENSALPIACKQTISQPYIVGLMSQALVKHAPGGKILEIGTGSGYQTAILASLFESIWTIERIENLYHTDKKTLIKLGFSNIHFKLADGAQGWPTEAPFDGIIVTAAPQSIPPPLLEQLNPQGGVLIIPLGPRHEAQKLTLIKKQGERIEESILERVCFVPLIQKSQNNNR